MFLVKKLTIFILFFVNFNNKGNKVDTGDGCMLLAYIFEFSTVLRKINLSNTSLVKESLETIMEVKIKNKKFKK